MIGPEDDWDAAAEGKPAGEGAAVTGTKTVGGYDVRGQPATMRQEESDRYRGIIGAAMERAGWAMEAAKVGSGAILSRFLNMVGGVVSDDGTAPVANQSPVGTAQRGLLDPSGAWWVRLVDTLANNWISERNAIVGEDSSNAQLEGLRVIKETSLPLYIAGVMGASQTGALTGSLFGVAYASLVTTLPVMVDRARWVTFRVTYTPGVTGAFPYLYPQISQLDNPEQFGFLPSRASSISQVPPGPTNPPTYQRTSLGHHCENIFEALGSQLVAATPVTAYLTIQLDDDIYPSAAKALRFAVRDSNSTTAGTVTIVATQG